MQKKKRERSVKHRLHDAGGKTDGKSTFFFGKFRGKPWFQKFLFSRSKTGSFTFFEGILENFREGPNQAMVFLSYFWFFGGFRSSRFHFENNLKIMRFHLLLISMLFVWFCYYCCSYFRLCDDDDGFPICGSMQHIAVDVSLRTHIRVIIEVWLGFLCLRG